MIKKKLMIVGVGGIGCEAVISVLQIGFNNIILVDLDHIERSNLNRQFLFNREDINEKKAEVAAKNLKLLFPTANITTYTKSILDISTYPLTFYEGIDLIISALDNLEARRHLNIIAQLTKKPFIDSGSQGFRGQVTPIIPCRTPCYECYTSSVINKTEPETDSNDSFEFSESENEQDFVDTTNTNENDFPNQHKQDNEIIPICSIRSIPSEPVHCAIWAKELIITELNDILRQNTRNKNIDSNLVADMVNEKIIENNLNLLEEGAEAKIDLINKMKEELICNIENFLQSYINNNGNNYEIEYDKENNTVVQLIALASNIKATIFKLQTMDVFTLKGMLSEIREAFISTNATIGCIIALMAKDILDNTGKMSRNTYWINQGIENVINRTKLINPDRKCKVCKRKVLKIKRNLLENNASWFFDTWLTQQTTNTIKTSKKVKLTKSMEKSVMDGEFVISYCNNDSIQMEKDLKELEKSMSDLLNIGEHGDFFYLDHDENDTKFYTVIIN